MLALVSPIDTPYHRLPAGAKFGALSLVTLSLFLSNAVSVQLAAVIGVAALYLVVGMDFLRQGLQSLRPLWPFLVIVGIWHFLLGDPSEGAVVCLRLLAAVALANLVTMTTRLDDAIELVMKLLRPLRRLGVQTGQIAFAIALVIRFVPVMLDNARRLLESWRARSARRPGWQVIAPIFLVALDDATRVAESIRARADLSTYNDDDGQET
ncbi:energy-coupling factor transporter transmembrane component T family protein [Aliiruegeria sabulilitoris]|uniref:energy-coupling factor transporter transmembrane component T family protein n=1 Tax=Aliiruegeria sabulilitoris TaxID=1510458 RepID=UPI000834AA93|nr:energy-coupling factor transporter transmembrane protein EcfT [Aliiruegeria sabulilitoris]NDR58999.1 energy-coupling factor transporter transmembrane protein EcfT [Pseudoruegeria sp. M32A2M]